MFNITVTPRFGDIDILGHVNNTVPPVWFELARTRIMKIFDPNLTLTRETFPLILVHTDYDFTGQLYIQPEIEIKTWISKIGTKSFTISYEAWQEGRLGVKGNAVIVCYDFNSEQSIPIPQDKRKPA
ncbi:MAG: acyl-CoA thioesterase [Treponema sp.]|jgi:acyl-CoA thioester hydrolase|nr:acyl-CoA thioesterase [Treponema sp.]